MAFEGLIEKIFSSEARNPSERITRDDWISAKDNKDKAERTEAQRLVDWYNRNTTEIVKHLKDQAKRTFKSSEIESWHWPVINSVARIIKRISMTYKSPPKRYLKRNGERLDPKKEEKLYDAVFGDQGMYRNIDLIKKFKELENWAKLLNTIHFEIVPRNGAIDWDIRLRPGTMVIEDPLDYLSFVKFAYRWEPVNPVTLEPEKGWVIWDEEQHVFQLDSGYRIGMSEEDGRNPYQGMIPIVTVRMLEQDEYWGKYAADLVDSVQAFHVQLANMWENALLQTHGQPIAINLGFKTGDNILIGPRHPISVENVTADDVMPALVFAKPDSDLDKVTAMLQFFQEATANSYGMPKGSWSMEEVPESGFAKAMNNLELLENRDDDALQWKRIEEEAFVKSRIVYNEYGDGEKIPEDIELEVEFEPVSFPESPTEEVTRITLEIKNDLNSRVRYFMEKYDITHDEAQELADEIAEENQAERDAKKPEGFDEFFGGDKKPGEEEEEEEEKQGDEEEEEEIEE